ncbi:zinc finger protein 267 [Athalia rosae]|uniref:zinc finger protein 267 n=1 Tax=Athalia rosae TaxID=37344 RepID=UPI0020349EA2|nr:zinc finger protein 267 [Athalia rosae]
MCAKLLACPLCSQPAFLTLDALRSGLISVATRPLACPVCNEILLGVDKLTIHLFSHTINLSDDGRVNTDHTKIMEGNSSTVAEDKVDNSQMISTQSLNVSHKECAKVKSFRQNDVITFGPQVTSIIAKTPLCKIANIGSACFTKDGTSSTSSQTCGEDQNQCKDILTDQIIFVQSAKQLHQVSDRKRNKFCGDKIYSQNTPQKGLANVKYECQPKQDKRMSLQYTEEADKTEQVQLECVENLSKHSEKSIESYTKSILQFQPIWVENSQPEIPKQNIFIHTSNAAQGQPSHQIVTIPPKTITSNKEGSLQPTATSACLLASDNSCIEFSVSVGQKCIETKNSTTETKGLKNHQQNLNQNHVLPQLKAFKALATKEKTQRCDVCAFYFSDPNILTLHKQLVHMINEKDMHKKPEDLLKSYPCHLCPKVFKMKGSLMVHMRVAHIGYNLGLLPKEGDPLRIPGEHGYNCPTCGKSFKKEQHVTQHLKTHEGKQWECDVCSKMFTTKYFLKKHKRLHSGEMPYKCNICDKTFTFQQSYHKHRLYHKDDKPHACSTCGRSFKELSTLHNHERIHTGEKPFACETCGKCFRQRVSYLVHRRIHTGAMPYKCTACGKNFRYKVSQRTHKCTAQPPGTVIRQSSDLVQRLLQVSQSKNANTEESNEAVLSQDTESAGCIPNEENRYILVVDNQGQHILTRQSEVPKKTTESEMKSSSLGLQKYEDEGNDETFIQDLWGHNILNGTTLKDSIEISIKNGLNEEQHSQSDGNNDFFSMVLSPPENEIQSPSSEMEHLRLSSPMGNENMLDLTKPVGTQSTDNFECGNSQPIIHQNLSRDNSRVATLLPTINEESLKQLLYGSEDRQ